MSHLKVAHLQLHLEEHVTRLDWHHTMTIPVKSISPTTTPEFPAINHLNGELSLEVSDREMIFGVKWPNTTWLNKSFYTYSFHCVIAQMNQILLLRVYMELCSKCKCIYSFFSHLFVCISDEHTRLSANTTKLYICICASRLPLFSFSYSTRRYQWTESDSPRE